MYWGFLRKKLQSLYRALPKNNKRRTQIATLQKQSSAVEVGLRHELLKAYSLWHSLQVLCPAFSQVFQMILRPCQKRKLVQDEEQNKKRQRKKGIHGSKINKGTGAPPTQGEQSISHYQSQESPPLFQGQAAQLQTRQFSLQSSQASLQTSQVPFQIISWLNFVHSHAFLPTELNLDKDQEEEDKCLPKIHRKIPPVILVGTHCDKIPKDLVEKKTKTHFENIHRVLQNSPLRYHLVDEFAVSNVEPDPTIDALKSKIFELAEAQSYWGQEIPARWLALRKALMEIKEKEGKMVIDYTEVESLNQSLLVKIESKEELNLFLEFEHELGNVIFFSHPCIKTLVKNDPDDEVKIIDIYQQ